MKIPLNHDHNNCSSCGNIVCDACGTKARADLCTECLRRPFGNNKCHVLYNILRREYPNCGSIFNLKQAFYLMKNEDEKIISVYSDCGFIWLRYRAGWILNGLLKYDEIAE